MRWYGLPRSLFGAVARDLFAGRSRSLLADSRTLIANLPQSPQISGTAELPAAGGCTLIFNHYERPGLWIGFLGSVLVDAVARAREDANALRFVVTDRVPIRAGTRTFDFPASRFFLTHAAALWNMLTLYADPNEVALRAAALRRALTHVRNGGVIAIAPEGAVRGDAGLKPAMAGTGVFLQWMSRYGPIVPAGVWEEDDGLHARFGHVFSVQPQPDSDARLAAMRHIAQLLPPRRRGVYAAHA